MLPIIEFRIMILEPVQCLSEGAMNCAPTPNCICHLGRARQVINTRRKLRSMNDSCRGETVTEGNGSSISPFRCPVRRRGMPRHYADPPALLLFHRRGAIHRALHDATPFHCGLTVHPMNSHYRTALQVDWYAALSHLTRQIAYCCNPLIETLNRFLAITYQ